MTLLHNIIEEVEQYKKIPSLKEQKDMKSVIRQTVASTYCRAQGPLVSALRWPEWGET